MAIAQGSEVAVTRNTSATSTLAGTGQVLFGIVIALSGSNATVLWNNGASTSTVPVAQLDQIAGDGAPAGVCYFNDNDTGVTPNPSPEYQCVVERGYTRSLSGTNTAVPYYLLRSIATGAVYEAPQTACHFINGR